ncbi:hypothetical protein [Streptomyces hirsutus]|uniref:hypothetical protein n=1 Tax=Streptomyces hirsutus TaxID=35620 RepID=UPI003332FB0E
MVGKKPKNHRLMRRGIPYGPEFKGGPDDGKDRGLMFVCYGTSLEEQFELVQQHWSDDDAFPSGKASPTRWSPTASPRSSASSARPRSSSRTASSARST